MPTDSVIPKVVPSHLMPFDGNAVWMPAMQVCWDMLRDEMNEGHPIEMPWLDAADAETIRLLNHRAPDKIDANHLMLAYVGPQTESAEDDLRGEARRRFGCEATLLDDLQWHKTAESAPTLLYSLLSRKFPFRTALTRLPIDDAWSFGAEWEGNVCRNVTYITAETTEQRQQVLPLFYDDFDGHAVAVCTKEDDIVVLATGLHGESVDERWKELVSRAEPVNSLGRCLLHTDSFLCPVMDIDVFKSFGEWCGRTIQTASGEQVIGAAVQACRMSLDERGGTATGEAMISIRAGAAEPSPTMRMFDYIAEFTMFILDGSKGLALGDSYPYLAVNVHDIAGFQDEAKRLTDYDPLWGIDIRDGHTVYRHVVAQES